MSSSSLRGPTIKGPRGGACQRGAILPGEEGAKVSKKISPKISPPKLTLQTITTCSYHPHLTLNYHIPHLLTPSHHQTTTLPSYHAATATTFYERTALKKLRFFEGGGGFHRDIKLGMAVYPPNHSPLD